MLRTTFRPGAVSHLNGKTSTDDENRDALKSPPGEAYVCARAAYANFSTANRARATHDTNGVGSGGGERVSGEGWNRDAGGPPVYPDGSADR